MTRTGVSFADDGKGSAMIVECDSCGTRYRTGTSIMTGFRGAKVRCRKCGGTFVVGAAEPPAGTAAPSGAVDLPSAPARGSASAQGKAREGGALAAGIRLAAPSNVYSLKAFREALFRKTGHGGFDISGDIRPEPDGSPEEIGPPRRSVPRDPAPRQADRYPAPAAALPETVPGEPKFRSGGFHRGPERGGASGHLYPLPLHIALVYLLLAVLGGCGYLLVRYISGRMIQGG